PGDPGAPRVARPHWRARLGDRSLVAAVNFYLMLPEIALAILALAIVSADLLVSDKSKSVLGYLAAIGLVIPAILVAVVGRTPGVSFSQTLVVDPLSTFFQFIFLFTAALVLLSSVDYIH